MSLSEFAAAIAPKVYGSSTMGVKKSTVCTRASSAVSLYTPASSAVSNPTSTFSSAHRGTAGRTRSNNFGLSFDAQPAALTWAVSLGNRVVSDIVFAHLNYNSHNATHLCFLLRGPAAGPRVHARFQRAIPQSTVAKSVPPAGAQRLGAGASGGFAGRRRIPARIPACDRNQRRFQSHLHRACARRKEGLGVLSQGRA